jgi:hypothetical protein
MDLTPGRQRLVFVVIVIALIGLTSYLIGSRHSSGTPAVAPPPSAGTSSAAAAQASDVPPSTVPAATPAPTAGGAEIYQWLPFTAADLSAAAQTTMSFAKDYSTWSYTESATAYAAKLSPLVQPAELGILTNGYGTAGVAATRATDKQVSTGSGTIDSIRSFGTIPTSITFVVTINEQVTSTQPTTTQSPQYAVTVASSGGTWQVTDLELAGLGNQGQGSQ